MAESTEVVVYVGNIPSGTSVDAITTLFVDIGCSPSNIEIKQNYAFVRVPDSESREKAIQQLHNSNFQGRTLTVQAAKGDGIVKRRENERRAAQQPTDTIFLVNYDTSTREEDVRSWCTPYGTIKNIQVNPSYAFVQYETVEQATEAQNALHFSKQNGKIITVEYSARDWNRRYSSTTQHRRPRDGGPRGDYRSGHDRGRSYSRPYDRSPSYHRDHRGRSPSPHHYRSRPRSPSPAGYRAGRDRAEPYGRPRDDYRRSPRHYDYHDRRDAPRDPPRDAPRDAPRDDYRSRF